MVSRISSRLHFLTRLKSDWLRDLNPLRIARDKTASISIRLGRVGLNFPILVFIGGLFAKLAKNGDTVPCVLSAVFGLRFAPKAQGIRHRKQKHGILNVLQFKI